jgi:hypothetical protein
MKPIRGLAFVVAVITASGLGGRPAHAGDDAAWLRDKGTLLFKDTFDREEDGNLAAAIGNGWNSATANRVPNIKQADLDGGVLKVTSAVEAGHQAHIHHEAGFQDGGRSCWSPRGTRCG